ncbi:MAG: response regulator [Sedimenticola sp.]
MRILVVEDNTIVAGLIISTIKDLPGDIEVDLATTAAEAVGMVETLEPDIVTLDIRLAEGDGYEVLSAIKHLPHSPRVIVLSNESHDEVSGRCMILGAERYFEKGSQFNMFISVLSDWTHTAQR